MSDEERRAVPPDLWERLSRWRTGREEGAERRRVEGELARLQVEAEQAAERLRQMRAEAERVRQATRAMVSQMVTRAAAAAGIDRVFIGDCDVSTCTNYGRLYAWGRDPANGDGGSICAECVARAYRSA